MRRILIGLVTLAVVVGLVRLCHTPTVPIAKVERVPLLPTLHPSSRPLDQITGTEDTIEVAMLLNLLVDDTWQVRVAACEIIAQARHESLVLALLPKAIDEDARVRSAALAALARFQPLRGATGEDSALVQTLLTWIDVRAERSPEGSSLSLCEIFADTRYVTFPLAMARRCLTCHTGREPKPWATNDLCQPCHRVIYEQWDGSAHARSLSHLLLPAVGSSTSQPKLIDFGEIRGINCVECHELESPTRLPTTAPPATACPYQFTSSDPVATCARCHADIHRQWRQWQATPHLRRAVWPPGHLETSVRDDPRSCVDCHMPLFPLERGQIVREHYWQARRDPAMLRQGLDVRVLLPNQYAAADEAALVLTNLAGHSYPTGTCRRGVRVETGDLAEADLQLTAVLSTACPNDPRSRRQPALAPGEQRRLTVPLPPEATTISYRVTYVRNLFVTRPLVVEIAAGERSRSPWMQPTTSPAESSHLGTQSHPFGGY